MTEATEPSIAHDIVQHAEENKTAEVPGLLNLLFIGENGYLSNNFKCDEC